MKKQLKRRMTVRICADGIKRGGYAARTLEEDIAAHHAGVQQGAPDDCWPWLGASLPMGNKSGGKYGTMTFMGKAMRAHRVAYMIDHNLEPIPPGMVIMHKCNFGLCCNPAHLELGTHAQNIANAKRDGLLATGDRSGARLYPEKLLRGTDHPHAKIDEDIVREIFRLRIVEKWMVKDINEKFGVTDASQILNGKAWAHVKKEFVIDRDADKKLHRENNGLAHRAATDDQVRVARRLFDLGLSATTIERKYGWSGTLAWEIVHRKKYLHVTDYPTELNRLAPRAEIVAKPLRQRSRTFSAPVTAGVTIQSGQVISLTSGQWVLGCAAGKEPFIAFADSIDTDVASSGQLLGLSCAGQFEIETAFFDNTATYIETSPLIAGAAGASTGATTTQSSIQAGAFTGNLALGTLNTAEDTLGFASNGGVQNTSAIATNGGPTNSQATAYSSTGAVLALKLLRFRTHWLPKATTSS
jgi:HNH endonuclease